MQKQFLSGAIVLSMVTAAFTFKPLGAGNIYCTPPGDQPGSCPATALIQYVEDPNANTANPCPPPLTPHRNVLTGGVTICQEIIITSRRFREVFD